MILGFTTSDTIMQNANVVIDSGRAATQAVDIGLLSEADHLSAAYNVAEAGQPVLLSNSAAGGSGQLDGFAVATGNPDGLVVNFDLQVSIENLL